MRIVVEGVDGAGKSTLSKALTEIFNAQYVNTSGSGTDTSLLKKTLDADPGNNLLSRFNYYLSSVESAVRRLTNDPNVVFDRYFYSTFATHMALDKIHCASENRQAILDTEKTVNQTMPAPDVAIFLYVDKPERALRLVMRDMKHNIHLDRDDEFANQTSLNFRNIAAKLKGGHTRVLEIETSGLSKEEVLERSVRFIKGSIAAKVPTLQSR